MNSFLKGFFSFFSWMDCYSSISPQEKVEEILENFYIDYPEIERNDIRALQRDSETIARDFYGR